MGGDATDLRAAIALALRGVLPGVEVVMSSTADRTHIEWRAADGEPVATFTGRTRAGAVLPPQQLALPMVGAPAPVVAPSPAVDADPLVELVAIEGWEPIAHQEALDPQTLVLWTPESTAPDADDRWRTVVPASIAARLESLAPGCFERRAPTAPSHLLRVGDDAVTTIGRRVVAGLVRDEDLGAGVALDEGDVCPVAWADSAEIVDGALSLRVGGLYKGLDLADGWWEAVHVAAAARAKSKKPAAPAKKPTKKPPAETSRWVLDADWQALAPAARAEIFAGANHLPAGSLYRELGPMSLAAARALDADLALLGVALLVDAPTREAVLQ